MTFYAVLDSFNDTVSCIHNVILYNNIPKKYIILWSIITMITVRMMHFSKEKNIES